MWFSRIESPTRNFEDLHRDPIHCPLELNSEVLGGEQPGRREGSVAYRGHHRGQQRRDGHCLTSLVSAMFPDECWLSFPTAQALLSHSDGVGKKRRIPGNGCGDNRQVLQSQELRA